MVRQLLSWFSESLPKFLSAPSTSLTSTSIADDLKTLEHLLKNIQKVLRDAEDKENREETVKHWLQELTDVAYDAEDVLLEYQYYVLKAQIEETQAVAAAPAAKTTRKRKREFMDRREEVSHLASRSNFSVGEVSMPHDMADRIRRIRERFYAISTDKTAFELKPEDGEIRHDSFSQYPLETGSMVIGQDIYGREDDKKNLVERLLSGSKFEVIAVVGKGGLGKTTLAQLVYNDPVVSEHFQDMRLWIWVPEKCDLKRLTELMIKRITNSSCKSSDSSDLRESLRVSLQGKRVLLVLDDVWVNENEHMQEPLSNLFHSAEMMKIIVTTRNSQDAQAVNASMLYHLDYLPWEQCWELFVPRAFGDRKPEEFPKLKEIGEEIVRKCDGLPQSVKFLGSVLRTCETDEYAWQDVLDSEWWELDKKPNILPALRVSYSRMPTHLRPCFEICSMFPKNHVFDKNELVKLWAAQGYILQREAGKDAEEMGHKYFEELLWRSFFDEYEETVGLEYDEFRTLQVKRYRIHDNIRDLARYILDETNMKHMNRHLCFRYNAEEFLRTNYTEKPRTLIVHEDLPTVNVDDIFFKLASLTHLRYLDLSHKGEDFFYISDEEFEGIGNLICLQHLKLDINTNMIELESFCRLYNLVVLEIRREGYVEFPESFRNLVSLTNIYFHDFRNVQLPALGELPSLKSLNLTGFLRVRSIGNEFCRGVKNRHHHTVAFPSLTSLIFEHMPNLKGWDGLRNGDFPQLQKLEINGCNHLPSLPALLKDSPNGSFMQNLTTLKNSHDGKLRLPLGFGDLAKLESLTGKFQVKNEDLFGILKKLVNVKYLTLKNVGSASMITQACLKGNHRVEKLTLKWHSPDDDDDIEEDKRDSTLCLIIEDEESNHSDDELETDDSTLGDEGSNCGKNASFSLLDNLQPHANLEELRIEVFVGDRCPSWIGDPSFHKLTRVMLCSCSNVDILPTLGQLPSLKFLYVIELASLERIGEEFCRGINGRHDVAAFPSLLKLKFRDICNCEEWDGVLDGDFPQLQKLVIKDCPALSSVPNLANISSLLHLKLHDCAMIEFSSDGTFPPNLETLHYKCCEPMRLSLGGKLLKLQRLTGEFVVGNDVLFEILKKLEMNHKDLAIIGLSNVVNVFKGKGIPQLKLDLKKMALAWTTSDSATCYEHSNGLILVVDDNNPIADDNESGEINGPSNLLENLWPCTHLENLEIHGYDDFAYPTWMGHPSFDKLTQVHLNGCRLDKLPTLGQLPFLEYLFLRSISRLKIIAHEFCRSTFSPEVAFPSLRHLEFEKLDDLEEWYDSGMRREDFPRIDELKIHDCPKLSSLGPLRNFRSLWTLSISDCPDFQLSSERSLPPNLKTLYYEGCGSKMCQSPGDKLPSGRHIWIRKGDLSAYLDNWESSDMAITRLGNVCEIFRVGDAPRVNTLSLSWRSSACTECRDVIHRHLVIGDNNYTANDEGSNEIEPSLLLEILKPNHTKLRNLNVEGYDAIGYPSWIGHPSFLMLVKVHLGNCKNEQLPSLGRLPNLKLLSLHFISRLKKIGHEFCRSTMNSDEECKVAFPSLTHMDLKNMNDLEEWNDVLDVDFPRLQVLKVDDCPELSSLWALRNPNFRSHLRIYSCPKLQLSTE